MGLVSKVKKLLNDHGGKGTKSFSDEIKKEFLESCEAALDGMLAKSEFRFPRPSSLNHGARKMYYMKNEPELFGNEEIPYNLRITFFQGHMLEAMLIALARTAGVKIDAVQKYTEYDFGHAKVGGTLDYIIDGEVRDAKTANSRAYATKWKSAEALAQHDPYGYQQQAALYSAAEKLPFTGWDVVNKDTGELKEVNTNHHIDLNFELMDISHNLEEAYGDEIPPVCHTPIEEVYRPRGKQPIVTGNKTLHPNCTVCPVRKAGKCSPANIVATGKRSSGNDVLYTEFSKSVNPYIKVVIENNEEK